MKLVLVEDDELVRATLAEGLEDAGLQVTEFSDPSEALHPPKATDPPDVVITDVDLGSTLNGFDIAAVAHSVWPSVRVVLINGLPPGHTGQPLDPRDRYLQTAFVHALIASIEEMAKRHRGSPPYPVL
jgi:CheY-like chemotaxis protein